MLAQGYVVATCPFNAQQWLGKPRCHQAKGVSDIVMKIIAMSGMGNLKPRHLVMKGHSLMARRPSHLRCKGVISRSCQVHVQKDAHAIIRIMYMCTCVCVGVRAFGSYNTY